MALKFEGSAFFRQRIVCSTLSRKPIVIKEIRSNEEKPGLVEYEASLLRLMEKLTNGTRVEIDVTGTTVYYNPGTLVCGKVKHDCGKTRSVGYFLEAVVFLAAFGKKPLNLTLTGITNHPDNLDISADAFRTVVVPSLTHFGIENAEFKVVKRGAPPLGGGQVVFTCPDVKELKPIELLDGGQIKRVRGVAYTTRASPSIASRMVSTAKGMLIDYVSDVFIYIDNYREAGASPGYGLTLVAETTTGCSISSEIMGEKGQLPEDVAKQCVQTLFNEILRGGCVDTSTQSLFVAFMALGPENVSTLRIGKLSNYTIQFLRHIKEFFGVTFQITPEPETKTVQLVCIGSAFKNLGRTLL